MFRRLLIGVWITAGGLGLVALCLSLWLAGRPLAVSRQRRPLVYDAPCCRELIPLPSTDVSGVTRLLSVFERDEAAPTGGIALTLSRAEAHPTPPLRWTENYLLVGMDRRPGTSRGGRTDTIVIAVFDRGSDHIGLISVPRDLYVNIPGEGPARINAAYAIAGRQGQDGLQLLERVVEDTLAIPIHHSVAVDLGVFERAVDALGGVTVGVPCPIVDNFVDDRTATGRRPLDVQAGQQHMDGVTAAMYVRSRHGRSDWDRARRQQAVLLAMRARLLSRGGISRLPALWEEFGDSVTTDMTRLELFQLAARALQADTSHLHGVVIGHQQTESYVTAENQWVLVPLFDQIDSALSGLFSAPSPGAMPRQTVCPAADVALNRPDRQSFRQHIQELRRRGEELRAGAGQSPSSEASPSLSSAGALSVETASNSDHSSSPDEAP